ncbi:MAG: tRNA (adenosine(37)-N6)-threonylcarbamoyltransferase complex transferase subunit TsaD [Ignavibacteriales bacterium]|nr:tRNA (adenosine(37)-N6)-threonylcarbamoyltransferase complex transferase subunit TsaD [Ignavibacteriales bacterium]
MNLIAFETSCDETSVAVIKNGVLAANIISSQEFHTKYGGVVPELSSRAHIKYIMPLMKSALEQAELRIGECDYIAATAGPGLIGALMIGFVYAKGLALSLDKPFIPVNHVEGHIYSGFLMDTKPQFPFLCLAVSGGHTLLVLVKSFTEMKILGSTIDDAAGEACDKVAKLLGLGYPGGPFIQKHALLGDEKSIKFPIAELKMKYDFSFSGLKTAVLRFVQKEQSISGNISEQMTNHIAASFQYTAVTSLAKKVEKAVTEFKPATLCLVGGVAANNRLRTAIESIAVKYGIPSVIPDMQFCGDNGAMIAFRAKSLVESGETFALTHEAFPSFVSDYLS